jgi:hypothetical protein
MARMTDDVHACPGRCGGEARHARLACKPCWFRLPKPLRELVGSAYRRRSSDPVAHMRAVHAAVDWYRDNPREQA